MSTIGVLDYDYFTYQNVIPNLECAKLVTYYRSHNDVAVLSPVFNPEMYTRFIIRKEYDDGIYPRDLYLSNCEYGGRAFTPKQYVPLDPKIERIIPDMHIYDKYLKYFSSKEAEQKILKRLLNCAHIRLAPDSQNMLTMTQLNRYLSIKPTGVIFHDYDLASLRPYDLLSEFQRQRKVSGTNKDRPYPIGNKYPIRIYSEEELRQWLKIIVIPNAFALEYYGYMSDETLYNLCVNNKRMARQVYYNVTYGCTSEKDFLMNRLQKIFTQALFLRRAEFKSLLKYDENFFKTTELKNLLDLINCWLVFHWQENFIPNNQTLYHFCSRYKITMKRTWSYKGVKLSIDELRDIFQYIRENNYEMFKMFYEWESVIFEGGCFKNEWPRN